MNRSTSLYFAKCDCEILPQEGGDFSGNGRLDFDDIAGFQTQLGGMGMSSDGLEEAFERYFSNVPEPSSGLLAVIGGLIVRLARGRRRQYDGHSFSRAVVATTLPEELKP